MMARLIELGILLGLFLFIFLVARKAWRRADLNQSVKDKLNQIEAEKEVAQKVVDINKNEISRNRKKISDFEKL